MRVDSVHQKNSPHILTDLVFAPDQVPGQEDTILLPLMGKQKVLNAISMGPGSNNMAEGFEKDNIPGVIARQEAFLKKNGFSPLSQAFLGVAVAKEVQPKIIDIEEQMTETVLNAECLFTTLPGIPLLMKTADCPTAVIQAKTKSGQIVLGIAHLGRPQVNERVTEQILNHLFTHYGCSPQTTYVSVAPSISPKHYSLRQKDQDEKQLIDSSYWGDYALPERDASGEALIRIDVLGKILSILQEYAIPSKNIEAYGHDNQVDTYSLAEKNPPEAFSYRYSVATNQPERNGRLMVVAQLPLSSRNSG